MPRYDALAAQGMPLVSLVVPVYNTVAYLDQCVASLLAQAYPFLEIILVDDGSTDGSEGLCDFYAKREECVCVLHQIHAGQSSARNAGMAVAHGKYLQFVDSDDWLDKNCVRDCVEFCEHCACDVVFFDAREVHETSNRMDEFPSAHRYAYKTMPGKVIFATLIEKNDFNVHPCLYMVRRSLLAEHRLSFPVGIINEDNYFSFCVFLCAERVGQLRKQYYFRRFRDGSTVTRPASVVHVRGWLENVRLVEPFLSDVRYTDVRDAVWKFFQYLLHELIYTSVQVAGLSENLIKDIVCFAEQGGFSGDVPSGRTTILYGYGRRCRNLLRHRLVPMPDMIWDAKADDIQQEGITLPDYAALMGMKDTVLIVCVDAYSVYEEVRDKSEQAGFFGVVHWCTYLAARLKEKCG